MFFDYIHIASKYYSEFCCRLCANQRSKGKSAVRDLGLCRKGLAWHMLYTEAFNPFA